MAVDNDFDSAASERKAIAIEFTPQTVRMMQLDRRGSAVTVRAFAEVLLDKGEIEEFVIKSPDTVAQKIRFGLENAEPHTVSTEYACCLIPQSETFFTTAELPAATREELAELIQRRLPELIPLDPQTIYWDWHRAVTHAGGTFVQIAAAPKVLVDSYLATVQKAGLMPLLFEPSAMAATRTAGKFEEQSDAPRVIAELRRSGKSVLSLVDNNVTVFSTSFSLPAGGGQEKTVRDLQKRFGDLNAYSDLRNPDKKLSQIDLYGDPDMVAEYIPLLRKKLKDRSVDTVSYRNSGNQILQFILKSKVDDYVPLLGEAMRGLPHYPELTSINLVPPESKKAYSRAELLLMLRSYLLYIAADVFFLLILLGTALIQLSGQQQATIDRYNAVLNVTNSPRVQEIRDSIEQLNRNTAEVRKLSSELYDWSRVLESLNRNAPGSVVLHNLVIQPSASSAGSDRFDVVISGVSSNREVLNRFVTALREEGFFMEVKVPLESFSAEKDGDFTITAGLLQRKLLNANEQ